MDGNRPLKVDIGELTMAMNDGSYEMEHYLDLDTGEVIPICDDYRCMEEFAEVFEAIENETERYVYVDKVESRDAYRDMEEFISTVKDEQLKRLLILAIDGRGAFSRFRKVIWEHPEENDRWFALKSEKDKRRALEFLDAIGVEPVE